jgi:MFS family permease
MTNPGDTDTPAWPVALAGGLALAAAMGIGRFAFTPLLPLMARDGQLALSAGAWLAAANYAGYFAGALTAPRLHWSARTLGAAALLATALATAAMARPGLPLWLGLRFVAGMVSAWAFVATSVWCLGALQRLGRADWGSRVYAGVGAGIALTGAYCLAAASAGVSAAGLWVQLGALALLLAVVVAMLTRGLEGSAPVPPAAPAARPAVVPASAAGPGLTLCYGLMGFGYILPATFLPALARSVVDDPRWFGLAWPVFGLTAAASTWLAGRWLRGDSRLRVWSVAQGLMGLGVLLPGLWLSGWTIALSALLVGGTFMVITLAGVQEVRARAPAADAASAVGRLTAAFAAGQIAGPALAALLLHFPGLASRALDLALGLGALGLLASAAWLWRHTSGSNPHKEMVHVR